MRIRSFFVLPRLTSLAIPLLVGTFLSLFGVTPVALRNVSTLGNSLPEGGMSANAFVASAADAGASDCGEPCDCPKFLNNSILVGGLVSGDLNQLPPADRTRTIRHNTRKIQCAIDCVGKNGGGEVILPEGRFRIAPSNLKWTQPNVSASLFIRYDNITLRGAGVGKTILASNGDYILDDYTGDGAPDVIRGCGIYVKGAVKPERPSEIRPRKNIVLKDFELFGGTRGYTGNNIFPANPMTGDGWDVTHKGIVLGWDAPDDCARPLSRPLVDDVTLENLYVHDFLGETVYNGGTGLGKVFIKGCKFAFSNASALNLTGEVLCEDTVMEMTAGPLVESQIFYSFYQNPSVPAALRRRCAMTLRNCTFRKGRQVSFLGCPECSAQAPAPENGALIENCTFSSMETGVLVWTNAHNVTVRDCIFTDAQAFAINSGAKNIEFTRNVILNETKNALMGQIWGCGIENVRITDNYMYNNPTLGAGVPMLYYYFDLRNVLIENNAGINIAPPQQITHMQCCATRPLFRDNLYSRIDKGALTPLSDQSVIQSSALQSPTCNPLKECGRTCSQPAQKFNIEPKSEYWTVYQTAGTQTVEAMIGTSFCQDGQIVRFTGGSPQAKILFPDDSETIDCDGDKRLDGRAVIALQFRAADHRWHEVADVVEPNVSFLRCNQERIGATGRVAAASGAGSVSLVVRATAPGATISSVALFAGSRRLGEATPNAKGEFVFLWKTPTPGRHALVAVATDAGRRMRRSRPILLDIATTEAGLKK
jgi:hypothetical protein